MLKTLFLISFGFIVISSVESSVTGYVRPIDIQRFEKVLIDGIASSDLVNIYYGVQGLYLIKKPVPTNLVHNVCDVIRKTLIDPKVKIEQIYYASAVLPHMPSCKHILKNEKDKVFTDLLTDETSTIPELYYATGCLSNLGRSVPGSTKLAQTIQTKLKTEDTLLNLGYTFHIASRLGEAGKFALDRVEEALVQADEVDGKFLQFEGGLSVTSTVLVGIHKLHTAQKVPTIVTKEQAEKFANYLVSRRTVQTPKGVSALIEAVRTFTDNPQLSPASISLAGSGQVTAAVAVRVCDILGNSLGLPADSVIAQSATRLGDDVVVLAKQKLLATSNPIIYNLELPRDRMAAGLYKVVISAGAHSASLTVTALAKGAVSTLEIGVADTDQLSAARLTKLAYPNKLSTVLEGDSQQVLLIKFGFIDVATKKLLKIQQAFLRLTCLTTKREIVFVAETEPGSNLYVITLDIGSKASLLGGTSSSFSLNLILGDTVLNNPIIWELGQLNVKLTGVSIDVIPAPIRGPKSEIQHLFREPERRPPQTVSMFFTGLAVAPVLLLFILWIKLGINVSNFRFSIGGIGFYLGLAGIFILYSIFWLNLNMFQTSRWLLLFGAITFLSGHRLLKSIAEKRKH